MPAEISWSETCSCGASLNIGRVYSTEVAEARAATWRTAHIHDMPAPAPEESHREVDMGSMVERAEQPRMLGFQREDADTLERGAHR